MKINQLFLCLATTTLLFGCSGSNNGSSNSAFHDSFNNSSSSDNSEEKNMKVIYFSCTNTTEEVANKISAYLECDYDGHTPIHEFGHMLGLRDYYPSDNTYLALGGQNMMDFNILDHDPYSKMLLEWADPLYYQIPKGKEITLDLKAFQGSNEFILLNNSWNHSLMDEYLLIEYYTPTLINAFDSKQAYISRPLGLTKPGIKIYHVDSRIAKLQEVNGSREFVSYTDTIAEDDYYYVIGASNNVKDSYTDAKRQGRYKQITLIENKEVNNLQVGHSADDESLFYEGDIFDSVTASYFPNPNAFNNKEVLNLEIIINSLSDESANITIRHKEM